MSGVLYPNSLLANPNPIQRKSTFENRVCSDVDVPGKTHFLCYFLFSSFIGGLKFSGFVFLIFGNSPQCGQNRIHCTEMPVTVLTGTRLSPRQTGNIRKETTFGSVVYKPAAAKTAQVLHLLPFVPCLYKCLFWDFISESLRLGNRKNLAWIGLTWCFLMRL